MTTMAEITKTPEAVTGVQLAQGVGVRPAKGFWADAWDTVIRRPGAMVALAWLGIVAFFAVFAPLLANGHPLILRELGPDGKVLSTSWPLLRNLTAVDVLLVLGTLVGGVWIALARPGRRAARLGACIYGAVLAGIVVIGTGMVHGRLSGRNLPDWAAALRDRDDEGIWIALAIGVATLAVGLVIPAIRWPSRAWVAGAAVALGVVAGASTWNRPSIQIFDYLQREQAGQISTVYTVIPWSPAQRFSSLNRRPPGTTLGEGLKLSEGARGADHVFILGTDALGQDVLSQLLGASRLAISIGLVSTGIAVAIGVTIGALMGYFGGWVDLLLFRVVEIFMAVPLLFLLIVAAGVLPPELRTVYTMMAIIGCFTWTGAARFTRAEFLRLRGQDFVQSAQAVGLPLHSVLFRHMLPNGVTPVLVDASFLIAAAITIEATLSFLGLGPVDQASWGKLLASATNPEGEFKWWLAVFPGMAIFLTVLSYNMIGEALRDAIDPKLKKARV